MSHDPNFRSRHQTPPSHTPPVSEPEKPEETESPKSNSLFTITLKTEHLAIIFAILFFLLAYYVWIDHQTPLSQKVSELSKTQKAQYLQIQQIQQISTRK